MSRTRRGWSSTSSRRRSARISRADAIHLPTRNVMLRGGAPQSGRHNMPAAPVGTGHRLESLDVLRGLTMAAMVIVNNPGDWEHVYPPLLHADWHGWTTTDLIFPA